MADTQCNAQYGKAKKMPAQRAGIFFALYLSAVSRKTGNCQHSAEAFAQMRLKKIAGQLL